jgi:hypothetical protein
MDYALLVAEIVVAIATLILAFAAWKNIRLTARLAKEQSRPLLIVKTKRLTLSTFELRVVNISNYPAHDVDIEITHPESGKRIGNSSMYMPPGDYLSVPLEKDYIGPANVKLDYKSTFEIPYIDEFTYIIDPRRLDD